MDRGKNVVVLPQNMKQLSSQFLNDEMLSIPVHLADLTQPIEPFTDDQVAKIKG